MKYYILRYSGPFGFIKPWTAVRDASGGETYSHRRGHHVRQSKGL